MITSSRLGCSSWPNFIVSLVATVGIARREGWGWLVGIVAAAGSIVAYVVSRTAGLPGHPIEPWLEPIGVFSLATEGFFILLSFTIWPQRSRGTVSIQRWIFNMLRLDRQSRDDAEDSTASAVRRSFWYRYFMPSATIIALIAIGFVSAIWLSGTEDITQFDLGAQHGLFVTRIKTTMLGSVVDVRLKIVDAEKAAKIFEDHDKMPYLLIGDEQIKIYAACNSRHASTPIEGRINALFFPNSA